MIKCKICESDIPELNEICNICSYNLNKKEIEDNDKLISYYNKLKKTNWILSVRLLKNLDSIYFKRKEIERLLSLDRTTISIDIDLAKKIEKYPELLKCKNKSQARKQLKLIENGNNVKKDTVIKINNESDLQNYITKNWKKLIF